MVNGQFVYILLGMLLIAGEEKHTSGTLVTSGANVANSEAVRCAR